MIKFAELLPPYPTKLWQLMKQVGVTDAVTVLPYDPPDENRNIPHSWERSHGKLDLLEAPRQANGSYPWDLERLRAIQQQFAANGLRLSVIESSPPMEKVRLGLPGRDEEVEQICQMLSAMGQLGIPVWCYNFLAVASWGRTALALPTRGGALVTAFNQAEVPALALPAGVNLTHAQLWDNLSYFLKRVVPAAETAGVTLALHPDDPPVPWLGDVPRIITTVAAFDRVLALAPSPANAITFCQGNFALMTDDLPGVIEHFGSQGKIAFIHFRNVRGTPECFEESFHDDGQIDMLACLRAYEAVGFEGVLRPDHVPTLAGETNDSPGYETLGRLFALGYLRGLVETVYGR